MAISGRPPECDWKGKPRRIVPAETLDYGADDPLVIEAGSGAEVRVFRAPLGGVGAAAEAMVADALRSSEHGPPLAAHVVAGDRVVVAMAGAVPQAEAVRSGVRQVLAEAGVLSANITDLHAAPLAVDDVGASMEHAGGGHGGGDRFDPAGEATTSYLAADAAGRPRYLARILVDADVVLSVGAWSWDAALGGRSVEGELWPTFSRLDARRAFAVSLVKRGRRALPTWRRHVHDITWQLGVCASLRLVAGTGGSLHAACFGRPADAARRARAAAGAWRPSVDGLADVAVVSLSDSRAGFPAVTRAVAAAARATRPGAVICVASRISAGPGIVFLRWRQGAPLMPLLREAVASGDPCLVADALGTRLFARALGDRRVVLLSDLDENAVEEFGFGHAATPEVVERLAHRAERVVVLHEADRMLPVRVAAEAGPARQAR